MIFILQTALELGFLYALVPLALFISFRILNIADLTTDGCFVLGAAVSVTMCAAGHPYLAFVGALLAGSLAGIVTAFLQTKMGVPAILAGIITNTGLYTINLMVMGWSSNVSLLKTETLFSMFQATGIGGSWNEAILAGVIVLIISGLVFAFLGTRLGLMIRASGDNIDMVRASSINPTFTITVGLAIANALTAISGALVGQYQSTVDINSGTGIVVIALACLIIGESCLGKRSILKGVIAAIIGSIIYRALMLIARRYGHYINLTANDLKLITGLLIIICLIIANLKGKTNFAAHLKRPPKSGCPEAATVEAK